MRTRFFALAAVGLAFAHPAGAQATDDLAHGAYMVNRVAVCGGCHTPHDAQHRRISGKELTGAPFPGGPPNDPNFAHYAPGLAGLPSGRTLEDVSLLLQTGGYADGRRVREPMPRFRWSKEDADAAAKYLASLKP